MGPITRAVRGVVKRKRAEIECLRRLHVTVASGGQSESNGRQGDDALVTRTSCDLRTNTYRKYENGKLTSAMHTGHSCVFGHSPNIAEPRECIMI